MIVLKEPSYTVLAYFTTTLRRLELADLHGMAMGWSYDDRYIIDSDDVLTYNEFENDTR